MKKLVILILIISLISGCQSKNNNLKNEEIRKIDQSTVYASINDNNIYIIDVREPDEYSQSHIENDDLAIDKIISKYNLEPSNYIVDLLYEAIIQEI